MSLLQHRIWTPRTCCKMFLTYANSRTSFVSWYLFQTLNNPQSTFASYTQLLPSAMTLLATSNSDDELIDNVWHVTAAWPQSWQVRWGDVSSIVRPSHADKYSEAHVTRDTALCPSLCTCLYVTTQTIRRPSVSTSQWIPSAAPPATVVLVQYSMSHTVCGVWICIMSTIFMI